jgi:hypothetical protein
LPRRFTRVLPSPSEGGRVSVYLAILGRRDLPLSKGGALYLAELVSVGHSGYSYWGVTSQGDGSTY